METAFLHARAPLVQAHTLFVGDKLSSNRWSSTARRRSDAAAAVFFAGQRALAKKAMRSPVTNRAFLTTAAGALMTILRGLSGFPVTFAGHTEVHRPHSVHE